MREQILIDVIKEADEYLSEIRWYVNGEPELKGNSIGAGSILHKKFKEALSAFHSTGKEKGSAEEILDRFYQSGMHWKSVNREKVLEAMKEYASNCVQTYHEETMSESIEGEDRPVIDWEMEYWKQRCEAAERFIEFSPIETDVNGLQINAHKQWLELVDLAGINEKQTDG